jgi:putative hemolysin
LDDQNSLGIFFNHILSNISIEPYFIAGILIMLILLVFSGLVSGSEVAFFSINASDVDPEKSNSEKAIMDLLKEPKKLLATILIANNFINVSIVIISTFISERLFSFVTDNTLKFIFQVILVTFLLLLVGEVIPKVYAATHQKTLARIMAYPLAIMMKLFKPFSAILVYSTSFIDSKIKHQGHNISVDDLSHALELTSGNEIKESDHQILEGIVKFGNTEVRQIMKSRVNVTAFEWNTNFRDLLCKIIDAGFSRVPVYKETFDSIAGILYIKDLLPYLDEGQNFNWQALVRPPFFIPENKKINELLKEFQEKKIHLAVVVDEYGGSSGIVTLEDIMEEIVGEISDEFDEEELVFSKLDDHNYVFEAKTALNDLYRVLKIDGETFEEAKGDSDTLAGFLLELEGKIPKKGAEIKFHNYTFKIESADSRRIKTVKVTIQPENTSSNAERKKKVK